MSKIVEGLKYAESHEWVKVEDGVAVIGVTDFAQKEMGRLRVAPRLPRCIFPRR